MNSCSCQDCGAAYLFSKKPLKYCLACGGKNINIEGEDYTIDRSFFGKSTVDEYDLKSKIMENLLHSIYTPIDVTQTTYFEECVKLYIPYYHIQADYEGTYTAQVGYDRTVYYTDYETRIDHNGRTVHETVQRSRTVTDWRNHSGDLRGQNLYYCIASKSFYQYRDFINNVSHCKQTEEYEETDFLVDMTLKSDAEAFAESCQQAHNDKIVENIKRGLPGNHCRNIEPIYKTSLTSQLDFNLIWVALCNYRNERFKYICDSGSVEKIRIIGDIPTDANRVRMVKELWRPFIYTAITSFLLLLVVLGWFYKSCFLEGGLNLSKLPEKEKVLIILAMIFSLFLLIFGIILRKQRAAIIHESMRAKGLTPDKIRRIPLYEGSSRSLALTLCYYFGFIGLHRFYLRKFISGIFFIFIFAAPFLLYLARLNIAWFSNIVWLSDTVWLSITVWSFLLLLYIIDYFRILAGNFTDYNGKKLKEW
ncbi:MAG: hypothetical protein LBP51_05565 [Deferribacteraceae bacterium]|jgi:hypothetical protein|nr:hypothetical protein [Deferribacteraceae bacterium]